MFTEAEVRLGERVSVSSFGSFLAEEQKNVVAAGGECGVKGGI